MYLISFTFIFFIISNQIVASENASKATQELTVLLSDMKTTSANFIQTVRDARGNVLQHSAGVMKIKRPLRFVWNTIEPYEQLIVSDGETMWVYDKDLEQVTIQALNKEAGDTPALLFSGDPELLQQHFDVRKGNPKNQAASVINVFDLYPTKPDAAFSMMSISFENKKLIAMELTDHLGQRTDIAFDKIKLN